MTPETILSTLHAHIPELHRRGISSLVLIGMEAAVDNAQALHFLIDFEPPHSYQQLRSLTVYLTDLLGQTVELVLVDPNRPAVQPYLDPDAVVIL
jgi:predicted nucleotidyltransferase